MLQEENCANVSAININIYVWAENQPVKVKWVKAKQRLMEICVAIRMGKFEKLDF